MSEFLKNIHSLEQEMHAANFMRQDEGEALIREREIRQRREFITDLSREAWSREALPLIVYSRPQKLGPQSQIYGGRQYITGMILHDSGDGNYLVYDEYNWLAYVQTGNKHYISSDVDYSDDLLLPKVTEYVKAHAKEPETIFDLPPVTADKGVKVLRMPRIKTGYQGRVCELGRTFLAGKPRSWQQLFPDFFGKDWNNWLPMEHHDNEWDKVMLFQNGEWSEVVHYWSSANSRFSRRQTEPEWPSEKLELAS